MNNKINCQNKIINNKVFKSASLIFHSKELGYLICEEKRYKEKKILLHPIGGKVEDYDSDIFSTSIREFIEETNLEKHPIINNLKSNKNAMILEMYNTLKNISCFIDICINKENNYYHRYYLVILDDISNEIKFKESIIKLPDYFNGNYKTEIEKIIWYKIIDDNNYIKDNLSWLTKMFFNLLTKKHK